MISNVVLGHVRLQYLYFGTGRLILPVIPRHHVDYAFPFLFSRGSLQTIYELVDISLYQRFLSGNCPLAKCMRKYSATYSVDEELIREAVLTWSMDHRITYLLRDLHRSPAEETEIHYSA